MDIHVLWISVFNYPCFYGYPFGYHWISMDIHALTCYGFSTQGFDANTVRSLKDFVPLCSSRWKVGTKNSRGYLFTFKVLEIAKKVNAGHKLVNTELENRCQCPELPICPPSAAPLSASCKRWEVTLGGRAGRFWTFLEIHNAWVLKMCDWWHRSRRYFFLNFWSTSSGSASTLKFSRQK